MAANDCWNAFGSDSESDGDGGGSGEGSGGGAHNSSAHHVPDPFGPAADAAALSITQRFVSLTKSSGVLPKDRVVGIGSNCNGEETGRWRAMLAERVGGRGMQVVGASAGNALGDLQFDAAILLGDDGTSAGKLSQTSCIKRALVPGGLLWLVRPVGGAGGTDAEGRAALEGFDAAVWDVASSSVVYSSSAFQVILVQKRACTINAWSCRWMDKEEKIGKELCSEMAGGDFAVLEDDTYLQYERRVASAVTVSPSVAERRRIDATSDDESDDAMYSTILTDASVQRATTILRQHGFAVIKGLLFPEQTIPWGNAVLSDFESAVSRLRQHPMRPVDLMNPRTGDDDTATTTEPRNYKELAMREDLRVDLRSGPEMERLRRSDNAKAFLAAKQQLEENANDGPTIVDADNEGTTASWRFHPSILAIIKSTFNPRNESLYKGNFGRWNFSGGGRGPDGSPQPFRLGQVGSVLSCPGSADQAIHADTPHLFEHLDCLPCHYCNVFTPGYEVIDILDNQCYQNEFNLDGIWTGNSTMGGTAFVQGSHKLSVTTQLLAEDDADDEDKASRRRKLLQLRTIRPALEAGDVLIFDCRTIHYGLANTSPGDPSGKDANAGRRPMLYLNVSQSWFHDPKNWNDRESIFD